MRRSASRTVAVVVAVTVVIPPLLVAAREAAASAPQYVALGDSYSSGTGTRSYLLDGTTCQRSVYAYPSLLAAAEGWSLNFRACSGATTSDVRDLQLSALSAGTAYVTISVGGNDAGFAKVLTACAEPWWAADCNGAIDRARAYITDRLPGALDGLYAAIRSRASDATVVVVGYPRIFDGTDCNALTWFSPAEMARLNDTADLLNATTRQAAHAAGFRFANPTHRFLGHAVCDDREWINGLSHPITESYHPKRSGHRKGYLRIVSRRLTGTAVTASPALLASATASAGQLAAQQRTYAERDRAIEPEPVSPPSRQPPPR